MSDFVLGIIIGVVAETCVFVLFLAIIFITEARNMDEDDDKMYSGDDVDDDDDIF